jgi:methionine sulfoxide reductase heme-binding subunit
MHLARLIKKHYQFCWYSLFVILLLPFCLLLFNFYTDSLGINPLEQLTDFTGICALNIFLFSLSITPLRHFMCRVMIFLKANYGKRLSDWNFLVKMRRMIGLFSFFYATLHVLIFFWLDQGFEWNWILEEMLEKPYLFVGASAFILLIPVAATSNNRAMRYLGKHWREIHRLVYFIGILIMLHFIWLSKPGVYDVWAYALVLTVLLCYRMHIQYAYIRQRSNDNGMELAERS